MCKSNKETNDLLKNLFFDIGDKLGGSACRSCEESYCCEYQNKVTISHKEFDSIQHLVTPEQVQRAKEQLSNTFTLNGYSTYRCPFLSEKGRCEIYDERFIICASYSIVGSNWQCSLENDEGSIGIVSPMGTTILAMEKYPSVATRFRNMAEEETTDVLEEFVKRYKL